MTKSIIILSIAALALGCGSVKSTNPMSTTNTNSSDEWISLFDGKTLNGWHTYGRDTVGAAWKVQNGAIWLDADGKKNMPANTGGDILTDEEFGDYHLKLEWKIAPNGNSGIIFNVNEDPEKYGNTYNTGPEMQVLDNNGHPDAKINKHRAGDLYDLIASKSEPVKEPGEWNLAEIISDDGNLTLRLNNVDVVQTTMWDQQWRDMIAGSKFASMPGFGTFKKGKIALQDHGDNVWYRNIMIKKL